MLFEIFLTLLVLLVHSTHEAYSQSTADESRPVPLQDIQDAVYASMATYWPLKKGDNIKGRKYYIICQYTGFTSQLGAVCQLFKNVNKAISIKCLSPHVDGSSNRSPNR